MIKPTKLYVLDTNVILHDSRSIFTFQENDVVIPIVVLEELDQFKKGSEQIHYQAREFMRELDKIAGDKLFSDGVELGTGLGKLTIETGKKLSKTLLKSFFEDKPDHRILAVTEFLTKNNPGREVILVTKDINLRMKAKSLNLRAQDYKTGKVDVSQFEKDVKTLENIDDDIISELYKDTGSLPMDKLKIEDQLYANQYLILKGERSSALCHFDAQNNIINRVEKRRVYGITPRNAEQTFSVDALMRPEIQLVTLTGKAGTGKTLMALAAALELRSNFQQILLARPIVPLANRDLGFLPGDVNEKIGPYMLPLYDNLTVIKHQFSASSKEFQKLEELIKNEKLMITPLAYIRGRSLSNVFFIIDEAQNLTPHEIKTIITRAGANTKLIFTGDIMQIDSPYLDSRSNGLSYVSEKMRGQNIFAHINLIKGERSYLADLASDLL